MTKPITNARALPIGAASRLAGVNIETIRYYERIGLLARPERTAGGNRVYDEAAVARLGFIRRCRELGFSIDEIRELLSMVDRRDYSCAEVHRLTVAHHRSIMGRVAALQRMAAVLDGMASQCDRGDLPDCPIIEALQDDRRPAGGRP
ncbi:MAG: MerR family transcriptional regulator [Alphaproteobacteria bacterium]|nr:MAG: MerR family transcriptional regulator [Alphaproteobacteria bacterium]